MTGRAQEPARPVTSGPAGAFQPEPSYVDEDDHTLLDDGYALVGAVHQLVSVERAATKADLILAAACHAMKHGGKTLSEVAAVIERVWPGARVDQTVVHEALELGAEIDVVMSTSGIGGVELWELTGQGLREIQEQEQWVSAHRAEAVATLRRMAYEDSGAEVSMERAELWLDAIVRALISGITAAQDAYFGRVQQRAGKLLSPKTIDRAAVAAMIDDVASDSAVRDFLQAAAIAALDPVDPFANELVHHITTGCVLHSYVAGRDSAAVIDELGLPNGQRALLDTPVLLDLVGPSRVSESVARSITSAVDAGWEVVVARHSIEELQVLLESEVPNLVRGFEQAHKNGLRAEWIASLTSEELPTYWLEAHRERKYRHPHDMIRAGSDVESLLEELGVVVRHHHNDGDRRRVDQCKQALRDDLGNSRRRSDRAVERDAESMAMIWRRRRRESADSKWPGGWIITPDRHLAPAYQQVVRHDRVPLTMTLSQWSTLASAVVRPAEVVALAEAAASQLIDEAMWLLPSRFPFDTAYELALKVGPRGRGSATDIRRAQLTLDSALASASNRSTTSLAAEVLGARVERVNVMTANAVRTAELSKVAAREREERALTKERLATEQLVSRESELRDKQNELSTVNERLAWKSEQLRRVLVASAVAFGGLASVVVAVLCVVLGVWGAGSWVIVVGAVFGAVCLGWGLTKWCTNSDERFTGAILGVVMEGLGLVSGLTGLIVDLPQL